MNYQPKGSMCASCNRVNNDCSNYLFKNMSVIQKNIDTNIVKCSYYKHIGSHTKAIK